MWWTQRLPDDALKAMLESSLCLGLYELPDPEASVPGRAPWLCLLLLEGSSPVLKAEQGDPWDQIR